MEGLQKVNAYHRPECSILIHVPFSTAFINLVLIQENPCNSCTHGSGQMSMRGDPITKRKGVIVIFQPLLMHIIDQTSFSYNCLVVGQGFGEPRII